MKKPEYTNQRAYIEKGNGYFIASTYEIDTKWMIAVLSSSAK